MDEDRRIIELCQAGRREGFAKLLLTYQARVYQRAYSFLHHREDALDITQEVFLRTIRGGLQGFVPGRPIWPWLRRITTNLCLNQIRDRHPTLPLDAAGEPVDPSADPEQVVMNAWSRGMMVEAMGRLPPHYRMALVLRHQEGLAYEEVARAMDLPLGTVKTYIFRGRQRLREIIVHGRGGEPLEV